ncbi:hypothetical protein [Cryobacterium ruanii]|uniref:hypothetical protein n=1 Tax=Cryobacterium ruanii TaxID=1259197 RepID=UPI001F54145C|nr:hypothetical protein [Cryobacterium ruanii]
MATLNNSAAMMTASGGSDSGAAKAAPLRNAAGLRRDLELPEILGSPKADSAGGLGVLRLAQLAGRDKGLVSRTLATLAAVGLVSRDDATPNYRLGYQLYAVAARTLESRLLRASVPYLRRMVTATHETTHLCVLRGGSALTLASELSEYAFRGLGREGQHRCLAHVIGAGTR